MAREITDCESDVFFVTQSTYTSNIVSTNKVLEDVLDLADDRMNFSLTMDVFSDISDCEVDTDSDIFSKIPTTSKDEFQDDDYAFLLETQKLEEKMGLSGKAADAHLTGGFNRFASPVSTNVVSSMVAQAVPKNTENKYKWAVGLFEAWRQNRNTIVGVDEIIDGELINLDNKRLDSVLQFFILEVKNKSGGDYYPKTLYEIIIAIQYYLRANNRSVNFLEDDVFKSMRAVLDAKMKELSKQGLGLNKKQACIISPMQEDILWTKKLIGADTPQQLLDTLVYTIGLNFALRAGAEHRNLRTGEFSQIKLMHLEGRSYLQYTEDVSKTNAGGLQHRNIRPKVTRAYQNIQTPERCVVNIYEKYMSKRPTKCKSTAFYLRPKKNYGDSVWYDDIPVGVHPLSETIGRLCGDAGFDGFFSNHSLRATAATRLFEGGVDEQLISEKTGHRSTAVRSYKRTSDKQQEHVSDLIQVTKQRKPEPEVNSTTKRELSFQCDDISVQLKF